MRVSFITAALDKSIEYLHVTHSCSFDYSNKLYTHYDMIMKLHLFLQLPFFHSIHISPIPFQEINLQTNVSPSCSLTDLATKIVCSIDHFQPSCKKQKQFWGEFLKATFSPTQRYQVVLASQTRWLKNKQFSFSIWKKLKFDFCVHMQSQSFT